MAIGAVLCCAVLEKGPLGVVQSPGSIFPGAKRLHCLEGRRVRLRHALQDGRCAVDPHLNQIALKTWCRRYYLCPCRICITQKIADSCVYLVGLPKNAAFSGSTPKKLRRGTALVQGI